LEANNTPAARSEEASAMSEWKRFKSPFDLFTVETPPGWKHVVPPMSEGAFLSISDMADTMIEGFGFEGDGRNHITDTIARVNVERIPYLSGYRNGRVLSNRQADGAGDVRLHRLVISYEERGHQWTGDYAVSGGKDVAVQLALKCPTRVSASQTPVFAYMLASLRTAWLPNGFHL
jgi:hypothetical protein